MRKKTSVSLYLCAFILIAASLIGLWRLHPGFADQKKYNPNLHSLFRVATLGCPAVVLFDGERVDLTDDADESCHYVSTFSWQPVGSTEINIKALDYDGQPLKYFVFPAPENRQLILFVILLGVGLGLLGWRLVSPEIFFLPLWIAASLWRTWTVFVTMPPESTIYSDMWGYVTHATEVLDGIWDLGHFFQAAGLNFWLALHLKMTGGSFLTFKVFQILITLTTAMVAYRLALRLWSQHKILAQAILVLMLFDAQGIWFSSFVLAEPLYGLLLISSLFLLVKAYQEQSAIFYPGLAGFVFMLSFYMKGIAPFIVIFFGIWILLQNWKFAKKLSWLSSFAAGCLIVMGGHAALSQAYYGKAVISSTAGGLNFVEGKCPWKNNSSPSGRWHSPLFTFLGENTAKTWSVPFTNQNYYWKQGLQCIQSNPWVMAESFRYIYYVFYGNPTWPSAGVNYASDHLASQIFHILIMPGFFLFFLLAWRNFRGLEGLCLTYFLGFFFAMWLFKSEARFRIPFDGMIALTASWGYLKTYELWIKYKLPTYAYKTQIIHPTLLDPVERQWPPTP
jgi:hypothetical protein